MRDARLPSTTRVSGYPAVGNHLAASVPAGRHTVVLLALVLLLIVNFDSPLGTDPASPLRWILPGLVLLAGVLGAAWGGFLRARRPGVYSGIVRTALAPEDEEPVALPTLPRPF